MPDAAPVTMAWNPTKRAGRDSDKVYPSMHLENLSGDVGSVAGSREDHRDGDGLARAAPRASDQRSHFSDSRAAPAISAQVVIQAPG